MLPLSWKYINTYIETCQYKRKYKHYGHIDLVMDFDCLFDSLLINTLSKFVKQ